jgi:hypothetical protein
MEMVTDKAMIGSISAPNSGSFVEKNIGSKMGQTDKKHLKKNKKLFCTHISGLYFF